MSDWFDFVYLSPAIVVLLLVAAGCVGYALHGFGDEEKRDAAIRRAAYDRGGADRSALIVENIRAAQVIRGDVRIFSIMPAGNDVYIKHVLRLAPVYFTDLPRFVRRRAIDKGIASRFMVPPADWWR